MFKHVLIVLKNVLRRVTRQSDSVSLNQSSSLPLATFIAILSWHLASAWFCNFGWSKIALLNYSAFCQSFFSFAYLFSSLGPWHTETSGCLDEPLGVAPSAVGNPQAHPSSSLNLVCFFLPINVLGLFLNPCTWTRVLYQLLAHNNHLKTLLI